MRRYETIFILDPDLSDDQRDSVFERVTGLITRHEGLLAVLDKWGPKKLAYEIKKKPRGYYIRLDYCGNGLLVNEIERFFRIDDRVLKYMTILTDKAVDLEKVKQEMAQAVMAEQQPPSDVEIEAEAVFSEEPEPETAEAEIDQTEDNREA